MAKPSKKVRKSHWESLHVEKIYNHLENEEMQLKIERVKTIITLMFRDLHKMGRPQKTNGHEVSNAA